MNKPKVLVCIPCYDSVQPHPLMNFLVMSHRAGKAEANGLYSLRWMVAGPKVKTVVARNHASLTAISGGASHLMFLDDDIVVQEDIVDRLLARDVDIISPLVFKTNPIEPLCFDLDELGNCVPILNYQPDTMFDCPGGTCTGAMMIKIDVLRKMEMPIWKGEIDDTIAEDVNFCKKVRELGFKTWCDSSVKVKQMSVPEAIGEEHFNLIMNRPNVLTNK